ncbi:MAG: T9SS type A sorting domain-containing protein [Bacteroidetes bacterium]|nr:T9SS type A sorting domain-containing protein [Bacteroidota bacterium]
MKHLFTVFLLSCMFTKAISQSDDCATATPITSNLTCSPIVGTTAGATQSMPACSGDADDDVWYQFTASSVSHSLSVTGSTNFSPVIEIYSGTCGSLTLLDCNDNASYGGTGSTHLPNLNIGDTYYFRVYHYYAGSGSGTFTVCLTNGTPPANDECSNAIAITSSSNCASPVAGTSAWASQSMPDCAGYADDDVWYKFVATAVSHSLAVTGSSNYSPVFEIFSGACGSLSSITCNDNASSGGTGTYHLSNLNIGDTYYIRVYHYYSGSGSDTFTLCLTDAPAPPNDDCSNAILVSASSSVCASPVVGSSLYGNESMPGCAGYADDDVWYKFVASAVSHSLNVTGSNNYDAVVELFSGNCGSLTSLVCSDMSGFGSTETIHLSNFVIGNTYYFRVYAYHIGSGSNTFTVCVTTPADQPPANDDCANAITIPVTSNCSVSNTTISSVGATQSLSGCTGSADDDVWLKFVATNANQTINVTGDAGADAVVQLFSGSCGSFATLACKDNVGVGQTESVYASGLSVGQTYYLRVYDYYLTGGKTFTVSAVTREVAASASATTICLGDNVTLTASGTPTYTWSNGISNGVAFTPTATSVYTVSGIGTNSCVNTATIAINVSAPEIPSICMVTVDTLNVNNVIYWEKSYNSLDSMIIYREVVANVYQRIGAVNHTAFSRFVDTVRHVGFRNGDPHIRSYKYKLQIRDTCGNYSTLSPYHTSLFLNNNAGTFNWNFYDIESQTSPVNNYELYRDDNNTGAFNLIGTVTATLGVQTYTFTDPNFSTFASTARWGVTGDGFSCYPSYRGADVNSPNVVVNKSKSNVKNNFTIPNPPADPDPQSVKELNLEAYIQIMPNPANDYVKIVSVFTLQRVNIYNSLGALVQAVSVNNETQSSVDLEALSNGIYSVEVWTQKGKIVKKLVIHK